ncbi:MAG: penicillin-binding protein activator [Candidatus Neomarinimicrobiota bacterium]
MISVVSLTAVFGQFGLFGGRSEQERFQRGVEAFNEGRYANAAGVFRKLVQSEAPELVPASLMMLMKSEYHAGNIEPARKAGRQFFNDFPTSSYLKDVNLCFGDIAVTAGQPNQALRMYLAARRAGNQAAMLEQIDSRLIRIVALGVPVAEIRTILNIEGNTDNRAILTIAEAFSLLLAAKPDEAAAALARIGRAGPPAAYKETYQTILRQTYQPEATVISAGLVLPLSGKDAPDGKLFLRGFNRAVEELKARGVIVAVSIHDNNSDAVESVLAVRQCAGNPNIKLLLGPLSTPNSIAAATAAEELNIPILIPLSTQDNLTTIGRQVFQLNSTLAMRGRLAGCYAAKALDLDSLAVLAPADEYGQALADAFITEVDAQGKKVVAVEWYRGIPDNLRPQFTALREMAFSLQKSDEYDQYLGMEIDSLDAMFDISEGIFFDIPESDDKPATGADSAKIELSTIQGIYLPIHPGHIQYLGTQFPSYNLETRLIGNENWLDLEILGQDIIGPHLEGMIFVSNFLMPADQAEVEIPDEEVYDSRFYYLGLESGLLLANLQPADLTSRAACRDRLASIDQYIGRTQNVSFLNGNNVNSGLRILEYHRQKFIERGFFHGDTVIAPAALMP